MFKYKHQNLLIIIVLIIVGTILANTAGFIFQTPWLMPILGAMIPYPLYFILVKNKKYRSAFTLVLFWAIIQSLVIGFATIIAPNQASEVILSGEKYTAEMLHWLQTGEGAEGKILLFLPIHLRDYLLFCFLSLFSLGSLSLILGTYLLNYMNFYVAKIVILSANPWLTLCLAWYPWSILRIIGYIATGEALTALGLSFIEHKRKKTPLIFPKNLLIIGVAFVFMDIVVKGFLAPIWQHILWESLK